VFGCVVMTVGLMSGSGLAGEFRSDWNSQHDRVWLGAEYWANPMEDWRINNGRIECITPGPDRNVHVLTRRISQQEGSFDMKVRIGRLTDAKAHGSAGFRVGIRSELGDYRSSLISARTGFDAGISTNGELVLGKVRKKFDGLTFDDLTLSLAAVPQAKGYQISLSVQPSDGTGQLLTISTHVPVAELVGNIAIVNNFGAAGVRPAKVKQPPAQARFWFADWSINGDKVSEHPDQAFGPILYAMHTLSDSKSKDGNVLKMTAQMPPIGDDESQFVSLQTKEGDMWKDVARAKIDGLSRTATMRVPQWNSTADVPYRLKYESTNKTGKVQTDYFAGQIRKQPLDRDLVVAGFTGNKATAFPNEKLAGNVAIHNPDVLFFSGDQIYEDVGGYGIVRTPPGDVRRSVNNYLRKIWLWGWAFRDLMRDRVTIAIADDHDVYQGNIWGAGGIDCKGIANHAAGGYAQHVDFVNAVHRTLSSHHPDSIDPQPIAQGMSVFHGELLYGRVSFAVIADRQFKSGPEHKVNTWKGRPDHMKDAKYDVSLLDKPGLKLLGDRQLKFLNTWAADWRGADAKCALSATIFCNLANYHGGNQEFIYADLDSNGWPQTGRNKALDAMRRGFALHFAGDQHLPSIVHHGIDSWNDAGYSFCVPSIAAGYPRSWLPDAEGRTVQNRKNPKLDNTGEYRDAFQNYITVHGIGNPAKKNRRPVLELLHDKSSGYGIVRFHKSTGEMTLECWRLLFDAANPKPGDQFPGWPKRIEMQSNYAREAVAWLPELRIEGPKNPVVQVIDEATRQIEYTLRIRGTTFRPKVFRNGTYTIKVGEQDGAMKTLSGIKSTTVKSDKPLTVNLGSREPE
ncbi:MAG: hypothetical protein O3A00_15590, partial [Planctomycetota bacterium]|nr:hypothetical protein [Planctomycetota bacterium]